MTDDPRQVMHDLSNLLTAIVGAAESGLNRPDLPPDVAADFAHILEGARRGAALIHPTRAVVEPVWLNQAIRATSRLLESQAAGLSLTLALSEPDASVRMVLGALDRILLNLVTNARQAMPAGGTVTIATETRRLTHPEPGFPDTVPPGTHRVLRVTDDGPGIEASVLPSLFQPGVTTRRADGGSGLGLASVRDLVHAAGGFVTVRSVEGRGTSFALYLPCQRDPGGVEGKIVLLVDDDPMVRPMAERILRRSGWTVLTADTGEEALTLLAVTGCDLLISDIAMPGMDGLTLAREVRSAWPDRPVILTSGYSDQATALLAADPRVTFLGKPYGQRELTEAAARAVAP